MRLCNGKWLSAVVLAALVGIGPGVAHGEEPVVGPDTLFVTWAEDPTSTAIVQWLERGDPVPTVAGAEPLHHFSVPRVEGVQIDGDGSDWTDRGFEVRHLAPVTDPIPPRGDLDAQFRLGWDERGLMLLALVTDDAAHEAAEDQLWAGDAIELFIGREVGSPQYYQWIIAPGRDERYGEPRFALYDRRRDKPEELATPDYTIVEDDRGYVIEALLPWENLGIEPQVGRELALQLYFADRDPDQPDDGVALVWYSRVGTHTDPTAMHALRLAERPSPPVIAQARTTQLGGGVAAVNVTGLDTLLEKTVQVRDSARAYTEAKLESAPTGAAGQVRLPAPPLGTQYGELVLTQDDRVVGTVAPPPPLHALPPVPRTVSLTGPAGGLDERIARLHTFGPSPYYVQRAVFRGLTPHTLYQVHVQGEPVGRFLTAPASLDDVAGALVFAEGGDVGTSDYVAPLHEQAAAWDPLFAFVGGDLAYANGRDAERWVDYLQLWRRHMVAPGGRLIPMIVTIGNHEVIGGFNATREQAPFYFALFDNLFAQHTYATLDFADYLSLILLDSQHVSPVAGEQTDWLANALDERRDVTYVLPAYHVPAYPAHRPFDSERGDRPGIREHWVPLFEQHDLPLVLEHDDHVYKRTHPLRGGEHSDDGVVYVGDGAWGMGDRVAATPEQRPYLYKSAARRHVIRVTLEPADDTRGIELLAVDPDGDVVDEFSVER